MRILVGRNRAGQASLAMLFVVYLSYGQQSRIQSTTGATLFPKVASRGKGCKSTAPSIAGIPSAGGGVRSKRRGRMHFHRC